MPAKQTKSTARPTTRTVVIFAVAAVFVVVVLAVWQYVNRSVGSFQACKDAGGRLLEIYPEQCLYNGKTFTNPLQTVNSTESYTYE